MVLLETNLPFNRWVALDQSAMNSGSANLQIVEQESPIPESSPPVPRIEAFTRAELFACGLGKLPMLPGDYIPLDTDSDVQQFVPDELKRDVKVMKSLIESNEKFVVLLQLPEGAASRPDVYRLIRYGISPLAKKSRHPGQCPVQVLFPLDPQSIQSDFYANHHCSYDHERRYLDDQKKNFYHDYSLCLQDAAASEEKLTDLFAERRGVILLVDPECEKHGKKIPNDILINKFERACHRSAAVLKKQTYKGPSDFHEKQARHILEADTTSLRHLVLRAGLAAPGVTGEYSSVAERTRMPRPRAQDVPANFRGKTFLEEDDRGNTFAIQTAAKNAVELMTRALLRVITEPESGLVIEGRKGNGKTVEMTSMINFLHIMSTITGHGSVRYGQMHSSVVGIDQIDKYAAGGANYGMPIMPFAGRLLATTNVSTHILEKDYAHLYARLKGPGIAMENVKTPGDLIGKRLLNVEFPGIPWVEYEEGL